MAIVGPLVGGAVGLAQLISQGNSQRDQRNLAYMNLFEQKRQAREREKLAKATRSDAYGNKVVYVPGVGFITETTPLTSSILNAQQKEQLAQFRDDAPRIRDAAERLDKRAKEAGEFYDELFNKYRYKRRKGEEEYIADAIRNTIESRRENKNDDAAELLSRSAMRLGSSGAARNLLKAAKEMRPEQTLSEAIAAAKKQGKQQYLAETGAENQNTFNELNSLKILADAVAGGNFNWGNENAALSGRADNALSQLIATNAANSQAVGQAYGHAGQAAGQFPNFGALSSSLSRLSFDQTGKQETEQERLLADLLLQQRIGDAQIGINKNNKALSMFKGNRGTF